jgi:NTP pyrophosphatase (non-canonical NTP hydrolase)
MDFNEYQQKAYTTANYPNIKNNPIYPTLGLCGESGEVAEKVKKIIRDNNSNFSDEKISEIKKELGDVLWYVAALASELGIELNSIAETNIDKLYSRKKRNIINGNGDNR